MPVIRGHSTATVLTPERRKALVDQLTEELAGKPTPQGPVIFEIPLEESDKKDVLVVWQAWEPLRLEDRGDLIRAAYQEEEDKIAQALGVTYSEAIEQQVLPYAVVPMTRRDEVDPAELRAAMLAEGGFALPGDKVELRFPTMAMAQDAHQRLSDKLPRGYWSVVQTVAPVA